MLNTFPPQNQPPDPISLKGFFSLFPFPEIKVESSKIKCSKPINGLIPKNQEHNLNPIHYKQNQINFLKEEISFKNIDHQVQQPKTKERVQTLLEQIQSTICSDIPNAFS